ncbi:DUF481 domain-containing protein [Echinicola vietnamensis]|uniref:Putative salt-induced outer membrane protein n=1 Tax=Echinicola vietnamensis (strain DSM 17526 / LMG 23754 / KMM 6221) TaxID=926556 RepID=L0G3R3_ECHVK|nr:DUF481 domain-containing protein [Echinicola vietnamensis]AGA79475.1 putative salt-induced outer membrane protein [Echinicola vietnamensis DSM 17526]
MKKLFTFLILSLIINAAFAREVRDSLIFKNDNVIVGEIKALDKGVVTIETDYSDSDFQIEWQEVKEVYSKQNYLITLMSGERHNGSLWTYDPAHVTLHLTTGDSLKVRIEDIVYFKTYENDFWSRLSASIDFSYSFTKANNYTQSGIRSSLGYVASSWSASAGYNLIRSNQDDVEPTRREDANLNYKKFLPHDFYVPANYAFLSNTEQLIDVRSTFSAGLGKYLIHTNDSYFGIETGISYLNEVYTSDDPSKNSMEAYFGAELNLYDVGDLTLLTKGIVFPGITEGGRWRIDYSLDTKYDLPWDLYFKVGFTLNFDNQPVEGAGKADYVLQTGVGWEL